MRSSPRSARSGSRSATLRAQQVWRGIRSRPTWRVLCYSTEDPPYQRGLVLVDAIDGSVVEQMVEDNPERWSTAPT